MPNLPARRIRAHQMRKRSLQLRIAANQRIVFLIGNLWRILGVIEPIVMRDLLCKPHQFIGGVGLG